MKLRVLVACECSARVRDEFDARGWEAWSADILECEVPSHITVRNQDVAVTDMHATGHGNHYVGDVLDLFKWEHPVNYDRAMACTNDFFANAHRSDVPLWDLIIAHPPCTDLSYAGAVWFKYKDLRRGGDGRMQAAARFFEQMLDAPSPLVAVENPHSIAQEFFGKPDQIVQPWWFGDPYVKGIHLWLKGLPLLRQEYTEAYYPGLFRVATGGGSWRTDKTQMRERMSTYEDSEGRKNRAKVRSRTMPGLAKAMAAQWGAHAELLYAGAL